MMDSAFRAYLLPKLGMRSIAGYISYARAAERELAIDLDTYDLSETGILALESPMPPSSVSNTMAALRAYAAFKPSRAAATPVIDRTPSVEAIVLAGHADPIDLSALDVAMLLRLHGRIGDHLRERGIVRTANALSEITPNGCFTRIRMGAGSEFGQWV